MQGVNMASKMVAMLVVVVVCLAVQVTAWGSYSCNLKPVDKQHIANATLQSAQQVNASLASLEEKVDTILALLQPPGPPQAPWLPPPHPKGTAEHSLSGKRERREREERSREEVTTAQNDIEEDDDRDNVTESPRDDEKEGRTEATDQIEQEQEVTKLEVARRPERREEEEEEDEDSTGPKKGECSVMVTDNHATIGMFYMTTYNHGHCANRYPITSPIRYCLGFCNTRTFVTRKEGMWSQGHECKSCQPSRMETLRIPLVCDDGFTFEKNFKNVVECQCTKCRPASR